MELVKPALGLIFWMTLTFSIVLWILSKYAWKPIMKTLKDREDSINDAIHSADEVRKQMENLKADNERLLNEARAERDKMLREAHDLKESIISQAKHSAGEEGHKLIRAANENIQREKLNALNELKTMVASLSVDMAEKILRRKMEDRKQQEDFVNENLKSINLN